MTSKVIRTLYRSLYRLGTRFDKNSASKYLIYRNVLSTDATHTNAESVYYAQLLDVMFGKSLFMTPFHMRLSLRQLLHQEFRTPSTTVSLTSRIDTGFAAYRKLSAVWRAYQEITESAQESETPSPLPDQAVRIADEVQPGVLLCAHPMLYGVFSRSVVLVLEHSEEGSYGLILNKETDLSLEDGTRNIPNEFLEVFGKQRLFFGGPLARLQYVHTVPDCGGVAIPHCSKNYYVGGDYKQVTTAVTSSTPAAPPLIFAGFCSWTKGQLERERQEGHWITVVTDVNIMLSAMQQRAVIPPSQHVTLTNTTDSDVSDSNDSTASDGSEESSENESDMDYSDNEFEFESEHYNDSMVPVVHSDPHSIWVYLMSKVATGFSPKQLPKKTNAWTVQSVDWPTF